MDRLKQKYQQRPSERIERLETNIVIAIDLLSGLPDQLPVMHRNQRLQINSIIDGLKKALSNDQEI